MNEIKVEKYINIVYSFANKNYYKVKKYNIDKNDFTQDLILYILENKYKYNSNKGNITTFIYLLMYNRLNIYIKSKDIIDHNYNIRYEEIYNNNINNNNIYNYNNIINNISISTYYYKVLNLSIKEISILLNISKSTIFNNLKKDRKKIKDILD
jgi:DNA-directed RNA polymerase specialized sigma24 family protein